MPEPMRSISGPITPPKWWPEQPLTGISHSVLNNLAIPYYDIQTRNGQSAEHCNVAFTSPEIRTLEKLHPRLEGSTSAQKNPHQLHSLDWASWVIAKLGGRDGIDHQDHLAQSHSETASAIAYGDALKDV